MTKRSSSFANLVVLSVLCLVLWEVAYLWAGHAAIASPLQTVSFGASFMAKASFWAHAGATLTAFCYAVVISVVAGTILGLALGANRFAGDVAEPVLVSLYTLPKITLYPVILLIFGLGLSAKVAFGVIHGVIPIVLFTQNAVKNVRPVLLRTARVMQLSPIATARHVLAPSILPELLTGIRAGFSLTLLGVLIGEMFASQQGLGFLVVNGMSLHNVEMTTFVILVIVVFALLANGALLLLDRRLGPSRA